MLTQLSFKAPSVELKDLNNLWFQLTTTTCNLKCKHCYLGCIPSNKPHFLPFDKIKTAIEESKKFEIKEIYLNGGEPLLHPDINNIIRLALKRANVTILTNGILINDKKTRFLRQIEQDHSYELIFRISLDHYTEIKNDEIRGKGSFKKVFGSISNLIRYGFNPIISAVNLWEEDESSFKAGFFELLSKLDFEPEDINLKIIYPVKIGEYAKNFEAYQENEFVTQEELNKVDFSKFDCCSSRVIGENGIYVCPLLVNDPRGKMGKTLSDSLNKFFLEPNTCYTCQKHGIGMLNNNWTI